MTTAHDIDLHQFLTHRLGEGADRRRKSGLPPTCRSEGVESAGNPFGKRHVFRFDEDTKVDGPRNRHYDRPRKVRWK